MLPVNSNNGKHNRSLRAKHIIISFQINHNYNRRNHIQHVFLYVCREFQPFSGIRLFNKVLPAPAIFGHAEHYKYYRTQWKNILDTMKSSRSMMFVPAPSGCIPDKMLKPNTAGRERRIIATMLTITAFPRLQPFLSIE